MNRWRLIANFKGNWLDGASVWRPFSKFYKSDVLNWFRYFIGFDLCLRDRNTVEVIYLEIIGDDVLEIRPPLPT